MTKLKYKISLFKIPAKNSWWILKLTGKNIINPGK